MAYYIDLFSPETYEAFARSNRSVSGFRRRHHHAAERVKPGDILVCYMTRVSRWFGILEVLDGPFIDEAPVFMDQDDPFVVRFRVKCRVWLDVDRAPPIHDAEVWKALSFTRNLPKGSQAWTGKVRGSLVRLDDDDGAMLVDLLTKQATSGTTYPLQDADARKLARHTVIRADKEVVVTVPDEVLGVDVEDVPPEVEVRESLRIQALLARIGQQMGMSIWIPRADRGGVLREWPNSQGTLLDRLPLNYDDVTLRTVEQIDVLWLRRRSIVRAFEVEHTTSIYSGILRMADLLALQPNMDIKLHIVAPDAKHEKVLQEIRRPVFSLLERGPLADSCTYLSYSALREVAAQPHLELLSDAVLDKYAEEAE